LGVTNLLHHLVHVVASFDELLGPVAHHQDGFTKDHRVKDNLQHFARRKGGNRVGWHDGRIDIPDAWCLGCGNAAGVDTCNVEPFR